MVLLGIALIRTSFGRALLATLALALLFASPASGAPADRPLPPPSTAPVYAAGQSLPIEGAWSLLARTPSGLVTVLHAVDLAPGHTYAAWWVVFNDPAFCAYPSATMGARCGDGDLPANDGDPRAGATVAYATGHMVEDLPGVRTTDFAAFLPTDAWSVAAFGPGLLDPAGAEVHLVLTDLGPVDPSDAYQIRALADGCLRGDQGDCPTVQISVQFP
jgi:hypothetical protein